jgi:hypothetical protein
MILPLAVLAACRRRRLNRALRADAGIRYTKAVISPSRPWRLNRAHFELSRKLVSIVACYPWVVPWKHQQQNLDDFCTLRRWFEAIRERPATVRAYAKGKPYANRPAVTEEGKKILFGQAAATAIRC